MKPPKILPWIARKARIGDELALKLWRRAASETEAEFGRADGSDYYGALVERFLALVEGEAGVGNAAASNSLGWLWRYQRRMAQHALTTTQSLYRLWESNCQRGRTRVSAP